MKKRSPDNKSGNGREPIAGVPANLKVADNSGNGDFLVVGIGASAGGVAALKSFFEKVAKKSGMAYVVILHLSPDYESKLAEVLQAHVPVAEHGRGGFGRWQLVGESKALATLKRATQRNHVFARCSMAVTSSILACLRPRAS